MFVPNVANRKRKRNLEKWTGQFWDSTSAAYNLPLGEPEKSQEREKLKYGEHVVEQNPLTLSDRSKTEATFLFRRDLESCEQHLGCVVTIKHYNLIFDSA